MKISVGQTIFPFSSSRSILTAGHCVCYKKPDNFPKCNLNPDKNNPVNQIIPGRDIYYVVGQQEMDERLRSEKFGEVLYNLPKAQKAFTYSPNNKWKKDIGLLIVDIGNWDTRVDSNIVIPIELPDKG